VQVGPNQAPTAADWTCLGTPSRFAPTTPRMSVTGHLTEGKGVFGYGLVVAKAAVGGATIGAFNDLRFWDIVATTTSLDVANVDLGSFSLNSIPESTVPRNVNFMVRAPGYLDTFQFGPDVDSSLDISSGMWVFNQNLTVFATSTVDGLFDQAGVSTQDNSIFVAGTVYDCQGWPVGNVMALVSSQSGVANRVAGQSPVYFTALGEPGPSAPTSANGNFAILNVPSSRAASLYVQAWGYTSAEDFAAGRPTLLGEQPLPLLNGGVALYVRLARKIQHASKNEAVRVVQHADSV
jgi:hypothetical protein